MAISPGERIQLQCQSVLMIILVFLGGWSFGYMGKEELSFQDPRGGRTGSMCLLIMMVRVGSAGM